MTEMTTELAEILKTLDSLQTRVKELTTEEKSASGDRPAPGESSAPTSQAAMSEFAAQGKVTLPDPRIRGDLDTDQMSLLRSGFAELASFSKHKPFPEYFARLAENTGLRLLLLKRWTSGLQVFMEKNIKMPAEAKRKRTDGRAPIQCKKPDIFEATGEEATVYSGPVPVQHFPLDLTLMLGRGSRDRQIIILPLPSQNHWNTFLYLDADKGSEKSLFIAEILAHFALARMCLLNKGVRSPQGRVARMRQGELLRRHEARSRLGGRSGPGSEGSLGPAKGQFGTSEESRKKLAELDIDPFALTTEPTSNVDLGPLRIPLAPPQSLPQEESDVPTNPDSVELTQNDLEKQVGSDSLPEFGTEPETRPEDDLVDLELDLPQKGEGLTPELILSHSGELPALPKAACHIMAVIEDPRTTATRLEKALAMDQALTAKVLRIANSPFYGAVREIRTVSEAIVRLGFVTIRNWTLVTAARSVFLAPGAGMMYQKIWSQSVLSGMAGQLVAQALGRMDAEGVFIGGLMQNIGQLVLARSQPVLFQEILVESETTGRPYHEVERAYLGFDHGELGALLIKEWNLSRDLEEAVRWHHDFLHPDAKNTKYAAMIALGEEIAWCSLEENQQAAMELRTKDSTESDERQAPAQLSSAARFLGISRTQLESLYAEAAKLKIDPHFFN